MELDIERILSNNNREMTIKEISDELLIIGYPDLGLYNKIYYILNTGDLYDKVIKTQYPIGNDTYRIIGDI